VGKYLSQMASGPSYEPTGN